MGNPSQPPPYSDVPNPGYPAYGPPPAHPTAPVVHTYIVPGVVQEDVRVVVAQQMGSKPAVITCKSCNHQIETRTERKSTIRTHLFALLLFVIGCWPCCCIPYCMDSCNNIDHYCPNCSAYIGSYMS